ncbi:MAG: hypothetical protein ACOCUH_03385, partial [Bacteriovoracia bacterium]
MIMHLRRLSIFSANFVPIFFIGIICYLSFSFSQNLFDSRIISLQPFNKMVSNYAGFKASTLKNSQATFDENFKDRFVQINNQLKKSSKNIVSAIAVKKKKTINKKEKNFVTIKKDISIAKTDFSKIKHEITFNESPVIHSEKGEINNKELVTHNGYNINVPKIKISWSKVFTKLDNQQRDRHQKFLLAQATKSRVDDIIKKRSLAMAHLLVNNLNNVKDEKLVVQKTKENNTVAVADSKRKDVDKQEVVQEVSVSMAAPDHSSVNSSFASMITKKKNQNSNSSLSKKQIDNASQFLQKRNVKNINPEYSNDSKLALNTQNDKNNKSDLWNMFDKSNQNENSKKDPSFAGVEDSKNVNTHKMNTQVNNHADEHSIDYPPKNTQDADKNILDYSTYNADKKISKRVRTVVQRELKKYNKDINPDEKNNNKKSIQDKPEFEKSRTVENTISTKKLLIAAKDKAKNLRAQVNNSSPKPEYKDEKDI